MYVKNPKKNTKTTAKFYYYKKIVHKKSQIYYDTAFLQKMAIKLYHPTIITIKISYLLYILFDFCTLEEWHYIFEQERLLLSYKFAVFFVAQLSKLLRGSVGHGFLMSAAHSVKKLVSFCWLLRIFITDIPKFRDFCRIYCTYISFF